MAVVGEGKVQLRVSEDWKAVAADWQLPAGMEMLSLREERGM